MELRDTFRKMISNEPMQQLTAEYEQAVIRYEQVSQTVGLYLAKHAEGDEFPEHIQLMKEYMKIMKLYISNLEARQQNLLTRTFSTKVG